LSERNLHLSSVKQDGGCDFRSTLIGSCAIMIQIKKNTDRSR
jgi:hypothetical protein